MSSDPPAASSNPDGGIKSSGSPETLLSGVLVKDFALKDYELKVNYLTAHFTRMWTRFNYFVVIESALTGLMFVSTGALRPAAPWLAIANMVVSLIWYAFGAQDRFLVQLYRVHVQDAADNLRLSTTDWKDFRSVGDERYVDQDSRRMNPPSQRTQDNFSYPRPAGFGRILSWRFRPLSTTNLASFVPLLLFLAWALIVLLLFTGVLRTP